MACSLASWLKQKPEESVKSDHGTEYNDGENQKKAKYDRDGNCLLRKMWFKEFEWLDHDEEKGLMFCNVCKKARKSNAFTCGKFDRKTKKDDLTKHANGSDHKAAVESLNLSRNVTKAIEKQICHVKKRS